MHTTPITPKAAALATRLGALVAAYQDIATTRMQGIPLLNEALHVQAVGFECVAQQAPKDGKNGETREGISAVGVLITPWFMNLVWLPLQRLDHPRPVGAKMQRHVGSACFEFIAAHEDVFGSYEACSLFSPVLEFENQAAAVDTAQAVLAALRQPAQTAPEVPARRAFLLGRGTAKAAHV